MSEMRSILATDCGSTTTKAILIEHDGEEFTLTGPEALTHQEIAETISGVIDARGVVRQHMAMGEQARIEGKVPPAGAPTLFARLGNSLALIWALALLGGSLVVNRRRRV